MSERKDETAFFEFSKGKTLSPAEQEAFHAGWQARADLAAERESRFDATALLVTRALEGDGNALLRLRRSGSSAPEDLQPLIDATVKCLATHAARQKKESE